MAELLIVALSLADGDEACDALERRGHQAVFVESLQQAFEAMTDRRYDLVAFVPPADDPGWDFALDMIDGVVNGMAGA